MDRQIIQTNNNKLFTALLTLSKVTIDKIIKEREEGKLLAIPYQSLPVASIDYSMETYNYDWNKLEYFDFYEWGDKDFVDFMDKLRTLPEFEDAAQQIIAEFKIEEYLVKNSGLISLLHLIMKKCPNREITHDNIDFYINIFIGDYEFGLKDVPVVWDVNLWLGNIHIESDEINIEEGVFLRRPTKEQLAEVRPKPNYIREFDKMTGRRLKVGAILSFSVAAGNRPIIGLYPEKILQKIEQWLNILRLFKPTDLTVIYQSANPVSIFQRAISENKQQPQDKFWQGKVEHKETSSFKLYLETKEEEDLRIFTKNIKPALEAISHKNYLTGNSYDLAIHRYNDSLLKTEVNAYKIISAMTSLEALLSDGSNKIALKIRTRVAKLLSFFGFNSRYVLENVKTAYNLRSKLVHGSSIEDTDGGLLEFAREHTHEIINYNRLCLLIALQLEKPANKQKLIKLIDNSLIDKSTDAELKKLIEENVKIPTVNPFPRNSQERN